MKTKINKLFLLSALTAGLALLLPGRAEAQSLTVLKNFTGTAGAAPGSLPYAGLTLSGSTLYGTTTSGGSSDQGTVFKVNTDGSGYTVLYNFLGGSDGAEPKAGLTLSGSTLYGTTYDGGGSGAGTVFKVNTDGSGYTVLYSFLGGSDGASPNAGLTLSGSTLYGTTFHGGSFSVGTVFKIGTDGSGYTVLKNFDGSADGANSAAGLTLSGSTLYGTTFTSGGGPGGTVFKMNTDGSGFTVLKDFAGGGVGTPYGGVTLSGSTLYGTTSDDFFPGYGIVFKVNTDGSGFAIIKTFIGSDGASPRAAPTLSGNTLYGTAPGGGSYGGGVVFKVNTDGSGYSVLKHLSPSTDGSLPFAGLTLSGSTLYGAAQGGGSGSVGTVFKISYSIVEKNGLVPTSPAGAIYSAFGIPARNNSNQVAFRATLLSGPGGVIGSNSICIYAGIPGAEALQARTGTFAPDTNGTPTAAFFSAFSDPVINNLGEVAFRGTLKVTGSVTTTNDTGIWSTAGGTLHLVAREGDTDPDTGGTFNTFTSFALPDGGDVVFLGVLKGTAAAPGPGTPTVVSTNNTGIWAYDGTGALHKVIRISDTVLAGGAEKTLKKITFLPTVSYSPGQTRSVTSSGDKIVYGATFTDGTSAILTTDLP